jgi:purine-nucleoside phosphorylase
MSFPNYPDKQNKESVLQPGEMFAFRQRIGQIKKITPPEGLIVCLQRGLPERMRWQIPIERAGRMMADLYLVKKTRGRVAVLTTLGEGSPMISSLTEELIAFGVKRVVSIVWGGTLQPALSSGDIVVCDRAVRDEGTSHHYLPAGKYAHASPKMVEKLKKAIERRGRSCTIGTSWTTDAPYRETREEVKQYQAEGVLTVEMEIASLFAVAEVRNIQVVSAVAVGDSLAELQWRLPTNFGPIERSLELLYSAAVEILSND